MTPNADFSPLTAGFLAKFCQALCNNAGELGQIPPICANNEDGGWLLTKIHAHDC
ncbi:MAG: hypothetical protein ACKN9E_01100 [Microcystaceae cyanobacterium]